MSSIDEDERSFYIAWGPLTDISRFEKQLCDLPDDIAGLVEIVQGWMLHIFWAGQLGQMLTTQRKEEVNIRSADLKLQRILKIDSSPLSLARPLNHRLVGNCRDYSLMMTALLKYRKIPARARCGFATYFTEGKFEDHWIVEYWNHQQQRWIMVDTQLDEFQRDKLNITFDPLDLPEGSFIPAGRAWQMCRKHQADPDKFGIQRWHGIEFVLGDLQRDLLALNKIEVLPWDIWGLGGKRFKNLTKDQITLSDRIALFTVLPDSPLSIIRMLYEENPILQIPKEWLSGIQMGFYR